MSRLIPSLIKHGQSDHQGASLCSGAKRSCKVRARAAKSTQPRAALRRPQGLPLVVRSGRSPFPAARASQAVGPASIRSPSSQRCSWYKDAHRTISPDLVVTHVCFSLGVLVRFQYGAQLKGHPAQSSGVDLPCVTQRLTAGKDRLHVRQG